MVKEFKESSMSYRYCRLFRRISPDTTNTISVFLPLRGVLESDTIRYKGYDWKIEEIHGSDYEVLEEVR